MFSIPQPSVFPQLKFNSTKEMKNFANIFFSSQTATNDLQKAKRKEKFQLRNTLIALSCSMEAPSRFSLSFYSTLSMFHRKVYLQFFLRDARKAENFHLEFNLLRENKMWRQIWVKRIFFHQQIEFKSVFFRETLFGRKIRLKFYVCH